MTVRLTKKDYFEDIENLLYETLRPVTPNPSFVRRLGQTLADPHIPVIRYPKTKTSHYALLLAASLLSSTFLILTGSRLVLAILGALGLLHYSRQQSEESQLVPSRRLA